MRKRLAPVDKRGPGLPKVIRVTSPARLVTMEAPTEDATLAAGAFVRLRPPEGTTPDAVTSWRDSVAKVALAVRVIATPQSADVPLASTRVDAHDKVGNVREEAMALAEETDDPEVVALVSKTLDEVGA